MKNICFIFLLLPMLSIGQNLSIYPIPNAGSDGSSLVHVTKTDNGMRVFTKEATTCGKLTSNGPEETKFNQFHVADYDQDGKMTDKKKYILHQHSFPSGKFVFKKGRTVYGNNEDVITYNKLVEMYPSLAEVEQIDEENRVYPEEYYKSTLKSLYSGKITGFRSEKMVKKPEDPSAKPKKGSGLLKVSGINLSSLKGPDIYDETNTLDLDWEESYKDVQKKSYWTSEYDAACQKTGNTLAYQAYYNKDDDSSILKQKEIVMYDVDGKIVNTIDIADGKQWKTIGKAKNTDFKGGLNTLHSISIVEKEAYHKKKNPDANLNALRIQNISSDGKLAYSHIVDYPLEYGRVDSVVLTDNNKTIVYGLIRKGSYFVTSCGTENCTTTLLGNEEKYYGRPLNFISTSQGDFAIFVPGKREFKVFPLTEGPVEPMSIPLKSDQVIRANFDYYESDQGLIFAFKDSSVGINKFRWEMAHVQLMQYKDSNLIPITNFEEDQFVLGADKAYRSSKFIEMDGEIYMIGRVFKEDNEGKLRNSPTLAKFKL